ncbi:MAG: hypothetical protein ACFFBD_10475 [Candidatus Hodarchaeota archaeon]
MNLILEEEFYLLTPKTISEGIDFRVEVLETSVMLPIKDQTDLVVGAIFVGTDFDDAFQISVDTIIPTQGGAIGEPQVRTDDHMLILVSDSTISAVPITDDSVIEEIVGKSREQCLDKAKDLLEQFQSRSWMRIKQFFLTAVWQNNLQLLTYMTASPFGSSTHLLAFPKTTALITKEEIFIRRIPFAVRVDQKTITFGKEEDGFITLPLPFSIFPTNLNIPGHIWNFVTSIKSE